MELKAVIKKSDGWWVGWLVDIPGVTRRKKTRKKLIESLRIGAEDLLNTPFVPSDKEELVSIKV